VNFQQGLVREDVIVRRASTFLLAIRIASDDAQPPAIASGAGRSAGAEKHPRGGRDGRYGRHRQPMQPERSRRREDRRGRRRGCRGELDQRTDRACPIGTAIRLSDRRILIGRDDRRAVRHQLDCGPGGGRGRQVAIVYVAERQKELDREGGQSQARTEPDM
jgi:hypothetical protein